MTQKTHRWNDAKLLQVLQNNERFLLHRRETTVLVCWGHAHRGIHRRRGRGRAVRAASGAGVVLRSTPAETHTGVTDGVSLHLVDGHLRGVALNELNETATLSRRDLDVSDLAESLEERTELILSDITRESTNEDSCVVRVSELVHRLRSTVETHGRSTHWRVHASGTRHAHGSGNNTRTFVLGSGGGDAHGTVAAVDTLHLGQSTLLVVLVGEANETIATRHAADGVGHDFGGLAGWESVLEQGNKNIFVDFRAEIADKDGVLGTTVVTASISKTATSGPIQLEHAVGVGHGGPVERKGLGSSGRGREVDEAISGIAPTRKLVADHLDINLFAHLEPQIADEVLIDPRLKLAHPESGLSLIALLSNRSS